MNKKGQVFEQFGSLATGIVALAILLVVAFLIMSQGKEQVVNLTDTSSLVNYTVTPAAFDVFYEFEKCVETGSGFAISGAYNDTSYTTTIASGNWTTSENSVNFSNKDMGSDGGFASSFVINYSCIHKEEAYNATSELQNATDGIPTWIPIIVITFIGVILLGLVTLLRRSQGR